MVFHLNDQLYRLSFQHLNPMLEADPYMGGGLYGTCARLERKVEGKWILVESGFSYLHPSDYKKFSKEIGRKVALERLTFAAYPHDKASRSVLWSAYFTRNEKPYQGELVHA